MQLTLVLTYSNEDDAVQVWVRGSPRTGNVCARDRGDEDVKAGRSAWPERHTVSSQGESLPG